MRCPFCGSDETQVKDSRPAEDGNVIRRRRFCSECAARFTTMERVQLRELMVIKQNGKKQPYNRDKLLGSLKIALQKRGIDAEKLERVVNSITRQIEAIGEGEVTTHQIGEMAMDSLQEIDPVGYVRFASVYRDFKAVKDFAAFIMGEFDVEESQKPEPKQKPDRG